MKRIIILILLCIISQLAWAGEYYYTCSYARPELGTNILFSKIDLDKKEIVFSKEIPITGNVCLIDPTKIEKNGKEYYFIASVYGMVGHNSPAGGTVVGYYSLITSDGDISQIDTIPGIHFNHNIDTLKSTLLYFDSLGYPIISQISLNRDNKVVFNKIGEEIYRDEDYPTISGFRYYNRIDSFYNWAFWNVADSGVYILLIDDSNLKLIDSLNVTVNTGHSYLFGLSPDKSIIYSFYLDCECKGWQFPTELKSLKPSYLKRYSASNLSFIDSLDIPNPCTDSICLNHSWASAKSVGNYIVYFFMETAHLEWFPPALLFIFDTRTNEATWLRVGWR